MLIHSGIFILSLICSAGWPQKSWQVVLPREAQFDESKLEPVLDYSFQKMHENRSGRRTDALLIVKDGSVIFERYENGFSPSSRHLTWSISKTISGLLAGIAEKRGFIRRNDQVSKYLPKILREDQKSMTVEDLLFWSSAIEWSETYEYLPLFSDVIAMLYTAGFEDMGRYALGLPLVTKPGHRWSYSSGDSVLLMKVLQAAVPHYADFPWTQLFDKLQMSTAVFERDAQGVFVGAGYFYSSARDLARVGYLILRNGVWNGESLLPDDWMSYISKPPQSYTENKVFEDSNQSYGGGQIWLNYLGPTISSKLRWKDAPPDTLVAMGHWGQYLIVIPSLDLVIVRFGDDRDRRVFDLNYFVSAVVSGVRGVKAYERTVKK